jgi:hypothetical protein
MHQGLRGVWAGHSVRYGRTHHGRRVSEHLTQAVQEAIVANNVDFVVKQLDHVDRGRLAHIRVLVLRGKDTERKGT